MFISSISLLVICFCIIWIHFAFKRKEYFPALICTIVPVLILLLSYLQYKTNQIVTQPSIYASGTIERINNQDELLRYSQVINGRYQIKKEDKKALDEGKLYIFKGKLGNFTVFFIQSPKEREFFIHKINVDNFLENDKIKLIE
jgi:hypothetical protein